MKNSGSSFLTPYEKGFLDNKVKWVLDLGVSTIEAYRFICGALWGVLIVKDERGEMPKDAIHEFSSIKDQYKHQLGIKEYV